jgi:hypothetical protein
MSKLAAAVAATLLVTACASPYADAIKTGLAACQSGDQGACSSVTSLQQADQTWHAQENEKAANIGLAILGGLAVGAAAYAASRPAYVAPVYVTPTYVAPTTCNSMSLGGGFVTTNCY